MTAIVSISYPGEDIGPASLLALADAFATASRIARPAKGQAGSQARAPADLLALHAIELALSAALLASGMKPDAIRSWGHDCAKRARALEDKRAAKWKRKTIAHIEELSGDRHYLKCRYDADSLPMIPPSRIESTLDEILSKTRSFVESAAVS